MATSSALFTNTMSGMGSTPTNMFSQLPGGISGLQAGSFMQTPTGSTTTGYPSTTTGYPSTTNGFPSTTNGFPAGYMGATSTPSTGYPAGMPSHGGYPMDMSMLMSMQQYGMPSYSPHATVKKTTTRKARTKPTNVEQLLQASYETKDFKSLAVSLMVSRTFRKYASLFPEFSMLDEYIYIALNSILRTLAKEDLAAGIRLPTTLELSALDPSGSSQLDQLHAKEDALINTHKALGYKYPLNDDQAYEVALLVLKLTRTSATCSDVPVTSVHSSTAELESLDGKTTSKTKKIIELELKPAEIICRTLKSKFSIVNQDIKNELKKAIEQIRNTVALRTGMMMGGGLPGMSMMPGMPGMSMIPGMSTSSVSDISSRLGSLTISSGVGTGMALPPTISTTPTLGFTPTPLTKPSMGVGEGISVSIGSLSMAPPSSQSQVGVLSKAEFNDVFGSTTTGTSDTAADDEGL